MDRQEGPYSIPSVSSVTSCDVLMPEAFTNGSKDRKRSGPSTSSETSTISSQYGRSFQRHLWIVACVSIFMCVVLFGLVAYLFIKINSLNESLEKEILVREDSNGRVCLPCEEIELGPFNNDNPDLASIEQKMDRNGGMICCAKSPNQTKTILELFWMKKKLQDKAAENIRAEEQKGNGNGKPAMLLNLDSAHLLLGQQNHTHGYASKSIPIRNWNMHDPVAHISGKLTLHNDRVRINSSGLYFVYSQVYFESVGAGNVGTERNIYHYVYRFNHIYPNGGRQLLLKSVTTQCWEQQKAYWDHTSYTAGAIHLNAGDEIYVNVTHLSMIPNDSKATFLGLFKIS